MMSGLAPVARHMMSASWADAPIARDVSAETIGSARPSFTTCTAGASRRLSALGRVRSSSRCGKVAHPATESASAAADRMRTVPCARRVTSLRV